jgi:hypothetical protein
VDDGLALGGIEEGAQFLGQGILHERYEVCHGPREKFGVGVDRHHVPAETLCLSEKLCVFARLVLTRGYPSRPEVTREGLSRPVATSYFWCEVARELQWGGNHVQPSHQIIDILTCYAIGDLGINLTPHGIGQANEREPYLGSNGGVKGQVGMNSA